MKSKKILKFSFIILLSCLSLVACGQSSESSSQEARDSSADSVLESSSESTDSSESEAISHETVEVEDIHGTVEVPFQAKKVVALDNRSFESLAEWGVDLAAVPKGVMPADSPYVLDENVQDIGNHREPDLEVLAAIQPDLVIVGQRFANYYEDIKEIVPEAAVVDFSFDVSETADQPGQNLVDGLKHSTEALAKIFGKEDQASSLIQDLDTAIQAAQDAYNGEDKIMSVIVSGGEIGYSAPTFGRVWGPLYEILDWQAALDADQASSDHQGDDISVEAIAQSNPDWLMVLDRDAAISGGEEAIPAKDVIEQAPGLTDTRALQENHVLYAPADTYTNESIQTYTELFNSIAQAFE